MVTVSIKDAVFFAYHGYYAEEQLLGGKYMVDADISFEPHTGIDDVIEHTVNYETVYAICSGEMQTPRKLIETVAQDIIERLKTAFPFAESIIVSIKKLHPPFKTVIGHTAVTFTWHRA